MNIEHRLQHAARDLREVPIVVPPLGHRAGARPVPSRLPVLATPVLVPLLFVAGALFAIGAARAPVHQPIQSDIPAIVGPVTDDEAPAGTSELADEPPAVVVADVPSVLDELEMIATLVTSRPEPAPAPSTVTTPSGARPTNGLGPI